MSKITRKAAENTLPKVSEPPTQARQKWISPQIYNMTEGEPVETGPATGKKETLYIITNYTDGGGSFCTPASIMMTNTMDGTDPGTATTINTVTACS